MSPSTDILLLIKRPSVKPGKHVIDLSVVDLLASCQQLVGDCRRLGKSIGHGKTVPTIETKPPQALVVVGRRCVRLLDVQDQGVWSIAPFELVEDPAPVALGANLIVDSQVEDVMNPTVVDDVRETDKLVLVVED